MEVDGHTHLTMAMINFMVAAVVSKTVALTGPVCLKKSIHSGSLETPTSEKYRQIEIIYSKKLTLSK